MAAHPDFYDSDRIGTLFYPDLARIASEAAGANLPPVSAADPVVHLVLIDMQVDFCHEGGTLYVPGALDDIRRVIEYIYRNAAVISRITCSLDSHLPAQIFSPAWWADADGNSPAPFTLIRAADVRDGRWRPRVHHDWSYQYVVALEEGAQKQLTIWPYHVQLGSPGNALDPELWSAVFWHALARQSEPQWIAKGTLPATEHYSIIQPEVPVPGQQGADKNRGFLDELAAADLVVIAGEAASHCVLETVEDIVEEFRDRPEILGRFRLLTDCTSPVVHPEIDFGALAARRFNEFARAGLQLATSTDLLSVASA